MKTIEIDTPNGPAAAELHPAKKPRAALLLGHGAGGGIEAPDLLAARDVALEADVSVALVLQPYRVAGKKSTPRPPVLDAAWTAIVEHLRGGELAGLPLISGGRSAGARVACRTATETDAAAVLCLAFPLQPPARKSGKQSPDRLDELDGVTVPMLVVQGERDRFGMPPEGRNRMVTVVPGDHGLKKDLPAVAEAVRAWLPGVL